MLPALPSRLARGLPVPSLPPEGPYRVVIIDESLARMSGRVGVASLSALALRAVPALVPADPADVPDAVSIAALTAVQSDNRLSPDGECIGVLRSQDIAPGV